MSPDLATLLATIVDWAELGKTVAASIIAGIGVTTAFAFAILGGAQFSERRRNGDSAAAVGAGVLGVTSLTVCIAAIIFGLVVML
ncbi:MAG: hypothetical protein ACR2OC_01575 [Solirubrobacterales bacterium]